MILIIQMKREIMEHVPEWVPATVGALAGASIGLVWTYSPAMRAAVGPAVKQVASTGIRVAAAAVIESLLPANRSGLLSV